MRFFLPVVSAAIAVSSALSASASTVTTTYTYDDLGRLSKVCYDNGKEILYSYDPAGNRTQLVVLGTCS